MATSFPTSLDTLTNPTSSDSLSSPSHSAQHANVNDAVEALQAKVGADSSAVTSSHDYLIADHASRITTLEGASSGKILQVVSTTKTDTFSASIAGGGSAAVTGLSATITPSSTSSKILIIAHLHGSDGRDSLNWVGMSVVRDGSTTVGSGDTAGSREAVMGGTYNSQASGYALAAAHGTYLDSPSTTSATTYAVHAHRLSSITHTVHVNRTSVDTNAVAYLRPASSITLMEVAG